jgi:hypothetical protein
VPAPESIELVSTGAHQTAHPEMNNTVSRMGPGLHKLGRLATYRKQNNFEMSGISAELQQDESESVPRIYLVWPPAVSHGPNATRHPSRCA